MKSIYFQSVIKMSNKEEQQRTPCVLEISDKGIKMVDKSKPGVRFNILHSCMYEDKTLSHALAGRQRGSQ